MGEEKKVDVVLDYSLVEVPTGKALAYQDKEGNIIPVEELLLSLANRVVKLEKEVLGK